MILVAGALIAGFVLAQFVKFNEKQKTVMDRIGEQSLLLLLLSMGWSLGSNPDLLAALPSLGMQSFLLAVGILVGSVGLTWLGVRGRRSGRD